MHYRGQHLIKLRSEAANLNDSLKTIHRAISLRHPCIDRIALATYDGATDMLQTFISSDLHGQPLLAYQAALSQVPSLLALKVTHQSRLIDNIQESLSCHSPHTIWLKSNGYQSSYTVPIFLGDALACFLFFDSRKAKAFDRETQTFLEVFARMIAQLYLAHVQAVHSLINMVRLASDLAQIRDLETGNHLRRMAEYSRLIARAVAGKYRLTDEFVEYVALFAHLHDIGKVGIPDTILQKPDYLDEDEWLIMHRHVEIGETLVDQIIRDMGLPDDLATQVMRNIVACHHERCDGSGYPRGLKGEQIPFEGQIVAVADVYDALLNQRPYKRAWNEAEICAEFEREVGAGRLDADCVHALLSARAERLAIQEKFAD